MKKWRKGRHHMEHPLDMVAMMKIEKEKEMEEEMSVYLVNIKARKMTLEEFKRLETADRKKVSLDLGFFVELCGERVLLSDEVFRKLCHPVEKMSFSCALEELQRGRRVAREHWDNKWLTLAVAEDTDECPSFLVEEISNGETNGWIVGHLDLLADDWYVIGPQDRN
jgi:hypothetical protein